VTLSGDPGLKLTLTQHYRVIEAAEVYGPWKVTTVGYFYAIADLEEQELIAFHWHPAGESSVTSPHAHLGPGARIDHERLREAHLPSGRISIEQVLKLAIDLGAETLRPDWEEVIAASHAIHEHWRSWA
jgi:hypothetical protein